MTPCEQHETIKEIWDSLDPLKTATARMEAAISRMVEEFTMLSRDLRENILNERELKTRLEQTTKDINNLYSIIREEQKLRMEEMRELEDKKLAPLYEAKNRLEGSIAVSKAIPIFAAFVSIISAIIVIVK